MKKYLIALVLGLVIILAFATTVALADNGPHGGFAANTDACAGCHRIHSASVGSNELLVATDPEALCLSCHDNAGTGAYTDVTDGVYKAGGSEGVAGGSLFAGGFENALMATAWSGAWPANNAPAAVSRAVTSTHGVGDPGTVWGSGANNSVNDTLTLECTSCHDPHGTAGWDLSTTPDTRVASYRLLRWQPSGSNGFTAPATSVNWSGGAFPTNDSAQSGWLVPDNYSTNGGEWYTIGSQSLNGNNPFAVGDYNNGNADNTYQPLNGSSVTQSYVPAAVNVAYFCAQCHDRYFNNSRMRNDTDFSVYCGEAGPSFTSSLLPDKAPVGGVHPDHPTECVGTSVVSASGAIAGVPAGTVVWGDASPSGDTTYMYRHTSGDIRAAMDGTSTAGSGSSVSRSCVACHVAHGTSAVADPVANGFDADADGSLAGGSVLMRMDGRTICLRCHASSVNFTVSGLPPTPTVTLVSPASGSTAGGDSISITGTGFSGSGYSVTRVRIGTSNSSGSATTFTMVAGSPAAGQCQVTSSTNIDCVTPAYTAGLKNVYVTSPGGTGTGTGLFTFVAP